MTQDNHENLLSRWSRRKFEAKQARLDEAVELAPQEQPPGELNAAVVQEQAPPPALTDADMPSIETLTEDSDYSGFMSSEVSDKLRNLALRKLFHSPSYNVVDGLDDYDEDYTYFAKLGDIVTCDMKHRIEMEELEQREAEDKEKEALRKEAEEAEEQRSEAVADDTGEVAETSEEEPADAQGITDLDEHRQHHE